MNTGAKIFARIVLTAGVMALLGGCIEVTSRITLEADNSGYIVTDVILDRTILENGFDESEADQIPEPLQHAYLVDALYRSEGARLQDYTANVTKERVEVVITTSFDDAAGMQQLMLLQGLELVDLENDGVSMAIASGEPASQDGGPVEIGPMVRDLADSIQLEFHLQVPSDIVSVEGLEADYTDSRVRFRVPLLQVLASTEPAMLEVNW